jgi:hypothetical protein
MEEVMNTEPFNNRLRGILLAHILQAGVPARIVAALKAAELEIAKYQFDLVFTGQLDGCNGILVSDESPDSSLNAFLRAAPEVDSLFVVVIDGPLRSTNTPFEWITQFRLSILQRLGCSAPVMFVPDILEDVDVLLSRIVQSEDTGAIYPILCEKGTGEFLLIREGEVFG